MNLIVQDNYELDPDAKIVLEHFDEPRGTLVYEVGANDNHTANVLVDNGYEVLGIDLRPHTFRERSRVNYPRLEGDFCQLVRAGVLGPCTSIVSTSAIEHFGLGTYPQDVSGDLDYDIKAMQHCHDLLRSGGHCYITVPYGRRFIVNKPHWRVYDASNLRERIIGRFHVQVQKFFLSAGIPGQAGDLMSPEVANAYSGEPPHVSIFLKLVKSGLEELGEAVE